jgi:HEAT repeats/Putative zinc-finger
MKCDVIQENIVLMHYGELPDEDAVGLEQHLAECEACRTEVKAMQAFDQVLALLPVLEPSPNMLAQSRMRLDEELDTIPPHGFLTRLRTNFFAWVGHLQSAPALATLLVGVGFLAGNFTYRYQVAHAPRTIPPVTLSNQLDGTIANVTAIVQTPNSELVQVKYNRVIPESMEGSLDSPEIRHLLMVGSNAAAADGVRGDSVALLVNECKAGHACTVGDDGIRTALLRSMRYDKDPGVRLNALGGLQQYVGQDQRVRDAVLETLMHDPSPQVRTAAIQLLGPVQSDSSVRRVLRTVSTQDQSPYIRTASFNALQGAADIQ